MVSGVRVITTLGGSRRPEFSHGIPAKGTTESLGRLALREATPEALLVLRAGKRLKIRPGG